MKTKAAVQHATDHHTLHTHQVGVMNKFIHLSHNEDSNRGSSTTPQIKDLPEEPNRTIKAIMEAEKIEEDSTFTLVTKR